MKQKILSLILAALLLASLLPTSALPVSAATEKVADLVSVRAITPFAGQHPVFESEDYSDVTDFYNGSYDIHTYTDAESGWKNGVMWLDRNGNVMTESDTFEAYQTYEVLVLVYAKNGYSFPKNPSTKVTAKVNDLAAKAASVGAGLKEGKDVIAVRYTFACRTSKTTIPKVAVEMDMSQIEDILVEGQELRYPEFTVTEGSEAKVEAIWYYRETEDDSWTQIYNIRIFEVKLGHYKLMLKPSIWDEHLHEIYQFPDSVPFYLNGVQTATLDYKDFYYGYALIGAYHVDPEEHVESVTVTPSGLTLYPGDSRQFTATVLPSTVKEKTVIWSVECGNGVKASINGDGIVSVAADSGAGELVVVATSKMDDRVEGEARVKVELPEASRELIEQVGVRAIYPFAGKRPSYETKGYGSHYNYNQFEIFLYTDAATGWKNGVRWSYDGTPLTESTRFVAGRKYDVEILIQAKAGYRFPNDLKNDLAAMVNEIPAQATSVSSSIKGDKDVIAVTYQFTTRTSKTTISKVAVEMDMSQIGDILTLGNELRYPEFTVTEGSEAKVEAIWYYRETEDDSWTQIYNIRIFEVKLGHYKLMLKPSIWDEHLHEIYQFPDSVPFYLNGVQTATLDYKDFYYGYAVIGIYTASAALPGDMDGDGDKDTDDAVYLLLNVMFGATDYPIANPDKDLNNDGKVNTDDAVYLLLHVMFGATDYPI